MNQPSVLRTEPGSIFHIGDRVYEIVQMLDLQKFFCKDLGSDSQERCIVDFRRNTVSLPWQRSPEASVLAHDLLAYTDEQWETARRRRGLIEPLGRPGRRGQQTAKTIARESGYSVSILYLWYSIYRNSGHLLSSLIDDVRDGGRGKSRLSEAVQNITQEYIESKFLSLQKPSIKVAHEEISATCTAQGLAPPSLNTVRLRISWIKDRVRVARREGNDVAMNRFDAEKGKIPNAGFPLQMAQMDHTPLPVIIVDDVHRKSIGRAYFTALIDVYSRVLLGIYLSLEAPSTTSAGMCMVHAMLTKDAWLHDLGLDHEWPFWGAPDVLHMDNAGEFRGHTLKTVANEYDIDLTFRALNKPCYGAHIERYMGTISKQLNSTSGATFSGPAEKRNYDAEGNACLTFDELHRLLVVKITKYHNEKHSALGMTPRQKWLQGLTQKKEGILRTLPPIRVDVDKVRMDFLPIESRTIQRHGVEIDKVVYQDDILHEFIGFKQPNSNQGVEYPFRRDPRDISEILFFHPRVKKYFTIASSYERMSIWEYNAARKIIQERGEILDPPTVTNLVLEARQIEDQAKGKTKTVRRQQARRKAYDKAAKNKPVTENTAKQAPQGLPPKYDASKTVAIPDEDD